MPCLCVPCACACLSRHHDDRSDSDDERADRKAAKKAKKEAKDKDKDRDRSVRKVCGRGEEGACVQLPHCLMVRAGTGYGGLRLCGMRPCR